MPALGVWKWPQGITWLWVVAAGVFGTGGHMLWTRALKLGVVERIIWAWILTIPASAGVAYLFFAAMRAMGWT